MKKRSKRNISCPNPNCKDFGIKFTENILVACTYKVFGGVISRKCFYCESCGSYFSETFGTFYYRKKNLKTDEVFDHLVRGVGIQDTSELVHVSKDFIENAIIDAGRHIAEWFNQLNIKLPEGNIEYDEMWTFVYKKDSDREDEGEMWIWISFHRESRFIINFVIGKHTAENGITLIQKTKSLTSPHCQHFTDQLPCYEDIFRQVYGNFVFPARTGKPGRPKEPYLEVEKTLNYGQVCKTKKEGKIDKIYKQTVFGNFDEDDISTSLIERQNLNNRQENSRLERKTLKFSKEKDFLVASFWIYFFYYNFIRPHKALREENPDYIIGKSRTRWLKRTPAMYAKVCDRRFKWSDVLNFPIRGS
jgi:IS1 family transposase